MSLVISPFFRENGKKLFCRTSLASIVLFERENNALDDRGKNSHSNNLNKSQAHSILHERNEYTIIPLSLSNTMSSPAKTV